MPARGASRRADEQLRLAPVSLNRAACLLSLLCFGPAGGACPWPWPCRVTALPAPWWQRARHQPRLGLAGPPAQGKAPGRQPAAQCPASCKLPPAAADVVRAPRRVAPRTAAQPSYAPQSEPGRGGLGDSCGSQPPCSCATSGHITLQAARRQGRSRPCQRPAVVVGSRCRPLRA